MSDQALRFGHIDLRYSPSTGEYKNYLAISGEQFPDDPMLGVDDLDWVKGCEFHSISPCGSAPRVFASSGQSTGKRVRNDFLPENASYPVAGTY